MEAGLRPDGAAPTGPPPDGAGPLPDCAAPVRSVVGRASPRWVRRCYPPAALAAKLRSMSWSVVSFLLM